MNHHFAVDQVVKEILTPKSLNRMMEVDFSEKKSVMNMVSLKKTSYFLRKLNKKPRKSKDTMKYHFLSEKTRSLCPTTELKQNEERTV
jgi:hypothetical protein